MAPQQRLPMSQDFPSKKQIVDSMIPKNNSENNGINNGHVQMQAKTQDGAAKICMMVPERHTEFCPSNYHMLKIHPFATKNIPYHTAIFAREEGSPPTLPFNGPHYHIWCNRVRHRAQWGKVACSFADSKKIEAGI